MAQISNAGSGFIKYGDELINLLGYREVSKIDEIDASMIGFTPFTPSKEDFENGVDGTWVISYDTVEERDEDFELIEAALAG